VDTVTAFGLHGFAIKTPQMGDGFASSNYS
jgi:hypothetical protein